MPGRGLAGCDRTILKRVSGEPSDEQLRETLRGLVEQELLRSGKRAVVRREGDSLLVGKGLSLIHI